MNINIFIASYLSQASAQQFSISTNSDADIEKVKFKDLALEQHNGISALDRSLNYGDGCFTTMYCESGSIFILEQHLLRLEHDAHKLGINFCIKTVKFWLLKACSHLLSDEIEATAIKILVSRGIGGRGYEPPLTTTPQVIIGFYPTSKLMACVSDFTAYKYSVQIAKMQLSTQPLLAGIKHLNRLEQVLAKQELQQQECDDLLLCNQTGNVVEATASNLFYLKNGVWVTPKITECGVNGVMRKSILKFMHDHEIKFAVKNITTHDLLDAESVFLCNAIKFIVPVSSFYTANKNVTYQVPPSFKLLSTISEWLNRENIGISRNIA